MEKLVAIALGISAMSMFLSSAAIWPHSQAGLDRARDAFLWAMFAFITVGGATISFRKMKDHRAARARLTPSEWSSQRFDVGAPSVLPSVPPSWSAQRRTQRAAPRSAPAYDRLELRPRSGFAAVPAPEFESERVYQATYYPE